MATRDFLAAEYERLCLVEAFKSFLLNTYLVLLINSEGIF
jgi:hypothetical protein